MSKWSLGGFTTLIEKTLHGLWEILWFLLIVSGSYLLYRAYYAVVDRNARLLESIGVALLTAGLVEGIILWLKMMGLFKKQLIDMIRDPAIRRQLASVVGESKDELIALLRDDQFREEAAAVISPDLFWKVAFKGLFLKKFPALSEQVEKAIFETYFPPKLNAYYDHCTHSIFIKFTDAERKYIEVKETKEITVITSEPDEEIEMVHGCEMRKDPTDTTTDYKLLQLSINDEIISNIEPTEDTGDAEGHRTVTYIYHYSLKGKTTYRLVIKEKKVYSLDVDNVKAHITQRFVNVLDCLITYPEGLSLRFSSIGSPTKFIDLEGDDKLMRKRFDGLMFPHQGYRIEMYRG